MEKDRFTINIGDKWTIYGYEPLYRDGQRAKQRVKGYLERDLPSCSLGYDFILQKTIRILLENKVIIQAIHGEVISCDTPDICIDITIHDSIEIRSEGVLGKLLKDIDIDLTAEDITEFRNALEADGWVKK